MSITKPYHRIWRPVKGYKQFGEMFAEPGTKVPTIDYLCDDKYACQAERQSLVTTAHLIMRDLYEVFNYVEPHEHRATAPG